MKGGQSAEMLNATSTGKPRTDNARLLKRIILPAGSGKTSSIQYELSEYCRTHPEDRVLAITYTNRAADELKNKLGMESRVCVSTIHSFINQELKDLFHCSPVIDEYFEWQKIPLEEYLDSGKHEDSIKKYAEKYGTPTPESVRKNTRCLKYANRRFGSKLYGTLGHDELLDFFVRLAEKYRVLRERIGKKYQLIIVDECQDTNPDVLNVLADIAEEFGVPMFIYGDMMQQIFNEDEQELTAVLQRFSLVHKPIINYRSCSKIVDMLNRLYNDDSFRQRSYAKAEDSSERDCSTLELIIAQDPKGASERIRKERAADRPLTLVVFNRDRFAQYGLADLYQKYSGVKINGSKVYGNNSEYSVANVLLPEAGVDSPDEIDAYMLRLVEINHLFEENDTNKAFLAACEGSIANLFHTPLSDHGGKHDSPLQFKELHTYIADLRELASRTKTRKTVKEILDYAHQKAIINPAWYENLKDGNPIYEQLQDLPCTQFVKQARLINDADARCVSTQHGVKGESHDSVIFLAEDSNRYEPRLSMYDCIELICRADDCNLQNLLASQKSIYDLANRYWTDEGSSPICGKNAFKTAYQMDKDKCVKFAKEVRTVLQGGSSTGRVLYELFIGPTVEKFLEKASTGSCTEESFRGMGALGHVIPRITAAFRILYVGCSRARKELCLVMKAEEVDRRFAKDPECLEGTFRKLGFTVHREVNPRLS